MSSEQPYLQLGEGEPNAALLDGAAQHDEDPSEAYDFLLVFPYTSPEDEAAPPSPSSSSSGLRPRGMSLLVLDSDPVVDYDSCLADYLRATPRTEDHIVAAARKNFADAWRRHAAGDEMRTSVFQRVLRELIIQRLTRKCNLQVKLQLSRDKDEVLCLVRATPTRLYQEADRVDYKLEVAQAVDPSYDFWTEEEIEADAQVLSRAEAQQELRALFEAGRIPESENRLFEAESKLMWSRRIQVLKRLSRKDIECKNRYPAFIEFKQSDRLMHLYRRRETGREGPGTLLRTLDRLVLTRSIIDREVDCDVLVEKGYLSVYTALHGASAGDDLTVETLRRDWVRFWTVPSDRPLWKRAFEQPLDDVRAYFGEKIAMYFGWLGFYTKALTWPAIFGCCIFVGNLFSPDNWSNTTTGLNPLLIFMCSFVCLWTFAFNVQWERRQSQLATRWGMVGFEEEAQPRPQFSGELRRSPVDNQMEVYYPPEIRKRKMIASLSIIIVLVGVLLCAIGFVFWLRHQLVDVHGYAWGSTVCSVTQAVSIQVIGTVFNTVAERLNDWENHRTQIEYEDQLIFKTFLFQMFNNYSALFYTAFLKRTTYGCDDNDCVGETENLLITIFIVAMGMNVVELGMPIFQQRVAMRKEEEALREAGLTVSPLSPAEAEAKLGDYDQTFSDYAEMILQFGFVTLFVAAFPLAPTLALVSNLVEIRVDAFKLCHLVRRPAPAGSEDIGTWGLFVVAMSTLALMSNTGIVVYTSDNLDNMSSTARGLVFVCGSFLIVILKFAVTVLMDTQPVEVHDAIKRHAFVEDTYVNGMEDDDDDDDDDGTALSPEKRELRALMRAQARLEDEAEVMPADFRA